MRIVDLIERFVRYPETLSQDQREVIEHMLEKRAPASALELYYREFYMEVDRLSLRLAPSTKVFLDSLAPGDSDGNISADVLRLQRGAEREPGA